MTFGWLTKPLVGGAVKTFAKWFAICLVAALLIGYLIGRLT